MNSLLEAKLSDLLLQKYRLNPNDTGTVLECIRRHARVAGHELDTEYRFAGLGAGPEGRVAASLVDQALLGGGCESSEYAVKTQIKEWLRVTPRKGKR